jgi:hypothetical protein
MGTLIRYINNRDLALENIVAALVRFRFVLGAPDGCILSTAKHMESNGYPLHWRSIIWTATKFANDGSRPGDYGIFLKSSRRNSKVVNMQATSRLAACTALLRDTAWMARFRTSSVPNPSECLFMIYGVFLNGRQYRQGDCIEYYARANLPQHRQDMPQGSTGSSRLGIHLKLSHC